MIKLQAQEGECFKIPCAWVHKSSLCANMLDMEDVDEGIEEEENEDEMVVIPLPNVESSTLQLVIMFLEMHNEEPMAEIERPLKKPIEEIVSPEDAAFIDVELPVLFRLILAANYMDIKELLDLSCAKLLSLIKGKSPDQLRELLGISSEFTEEEKATLLEEGQWDP